MKPDSQTRKYSQNFLANAALIIATIIFGSTFIGAKVILSDIDPVALTGYRGLITAFILLVYLLLKKQNVFLYFKSGFWIGCLIFIAFTAQTVGLAYTSALNSGFITGLFVIFVPIFSCIFLRTSLGYEKWIAIFMALAGLWCATGGLHNFNLGDFITLAGAAFWGFYVLAVDNVMKKHGNGVLLNFQQFLVLGILSLITMLIFHLPFSIRSVNACYMLLYLAIFANLIGYCLQFLGQKHLSPVNVAVVLLLEPVFAAIFAWTLGDEVFTLMKVLGGILIVAAIALTEIPVNKIKLFVKRSLNFNS